MAIDQEMLRRAGNQISSAASLLQSAAEKLRPLPDAGGQPAQDKCNQSEASYVPPAATDFRYVRSKSPGYADLLSELMPEVSVASRNIFQCAVDLIRKLRTQLATAEKQRDEARTERDDQLRVIDSLTAERDRLQADHQKLELEMAYRHDPDGDMLRALRRYYQGGGFDLRLPQKGEWILSVTNNFKHPIVASHDYETPRVIVPAPPPAEPTLAEINAAYKLYVDSVQLEFRPLRAGDVFISALTGNKLIADHIDGSKGARRLVIKPAH